MYRFLILLLYAAFINAAISDINAQENNKNFDPLVYYKYYISEAENLKIGETLPVNQFLLYEPTLEFIDIVKDKYFLIAHGKLRALNTPAHGPIRLINSETGDELWRIEREKKNQNFKFSLIYNKDFLIIKKTVNVNNAFNVYTAYNIEDGSVIWEIEEKDQYHYGVFPEAECLVLITGKKKKKIKFFDLITGNIYKENDIKKIEIDTKATVELFNDKLWLIGNGTNFYNIKDGELLRTNNDIGPLNPKTYPVETEKYIYLGIKDSNLIKVNKTGEIIWSCVFDEGLGLFSKYKDRLYVNSEYTKPGYLYIESYINIVSANDGKLIRKEEFKGELKSRFLFKDNSFFFTTSNGIIEMGFNGDIIKKKNIKSEVFTLADQLISYPEHVVVIKEHSISAFDWDDLSEKWRFDMKGVYPKWNDVYFDYDFELHYPFEVRKELLGRFSYPTFRASTYERSGQVLFNEIKNNRPSLTGVYGSTVDYSWLDKNRRTELNRMYDNGLISESSYISFHESQVSFEKSMAAVNLMSVAISTYELADQIKEAMNSSIYGYNVPLETQFLISPYNASVYNDYFVKSFIRKKITEPGRYGFLAVNMQTGEWTEVTTGSDKLSGTAVVDLNLLPCLFSENGKYIFTRGTGLEPEKWKLGLGSGKRMKRRPPFSLLKYDIDDLEFNDYDQFSGRYKYLGGNFIIAEEILKEINPGEINLQDMIIKLGQPYQNISDMYVYWIYIIEIDGDVNSDGIRCEFDSKTGVLKKIERDSNPYEILEKKINHHKDFIKISNKIFNLD